VVSQSGPTVTFFDAVDHHVRTELTLDREPHELCFDAEHRLLYCSHPYIGGFYDRNDGRNHILSVIDPDAGKIVDVIDLSPEHGPHGLVLDAARRRLYISVEGSATRPGGILVMDTATRCVLGRVDTLAHGPHWFAVEPRSLRAYAANKEAPFVTVVDLRTGALVRKVEVPGSEGISASPNGSMVAVVSPKADLGRLAAPPGVQLIDTRTSEIVRTLRTEHALTPVHWTTTGLLLAGEVLEGPDPNNPRVDMPGGRLRVWAGGSAATMEHVGSVEVGANPLNVITTPDGGRAYVSAIVDSTVSVVDLRDPSRPTLLRTLSIPRAGAWGAHGLAYVPARSRR
jgi:DNA-binding beta-propeller fold protein YncE